MSLNKSIVQVGVLIAGLVVGQVVFAAEPVAADAATAPATDGATAPKDGPAAPVAAPAPTAVAPSGCYVTIGGKTTWVSPCPK